MVVYRSCPKCAGICYCYPPETYKVPPKVPPKVPYKCPICHGRGYVPHDFYNPYAGTTTVTNTTETCRACGGAGIIWGS